MPGELYFPTPDDEPEADSRFWYIERKDRFDDPAMVYMWACAVLRQAERYNAAVQAHRVLEQHERHGEQPVTSDDWLDAWCLERTELHLLMECALQVYRWATLPAADDSKDWTNRRLIYDLPSLDESEWIKITRDLLVHADEAFRGIEGRAVKKAKVKPPQINVPELVGLAKALIASFDWVEPPYDIDD